MRIGFITDLSEADFKFSAKNGIPCVEYNFSDNIDAAKSFGAVKRHMKKYGTEFSMIGMFGRNYISSDRKEADRHMHDAKALVDLCQDIGAPCFVTGAGHAENRTLEENVERASSFFGSLLDYAKGKNVRVALYNCHWGNFAFGPDSWRMLLPRLPELGLKYDPSHTFYDGRDYLQELLDWGNRVYHMHAKGAIRIGGKRFEDPPAGLDQIDWGSIMAVMYHHKYEGDINIEPHSGVWLAERRHDGILMARRHLLQFIASET